MTWNRALHMYIDLNSVGQENPLLKKTSDAMSQMTQSQVLIQGDVLPVILHLMTESAGVWTHERLAGSVLIMAAKSTAAGSVLFSISDFTELELDDGNYAYQGTLNLTGSALSSALTGTTLPVTCDLEIQNADNTQRTTFQFGITIKKQYYAGTEADPTVGEPLYPSPSAIVTRNAGTHAMVAKTDTIDISACGFSTAPAIVLVTPINADSVVFACVTSITATEVGVEVSGDYDGTTLAWLAIP